MISDSGGGSKIRLIGRRMFILTAAKAVVVFGIVGRLISLQINESKKYKTLSDKNRFREWKFAPPRGVIKDYFGEEIASNEKVFQLHLIPENAENLSALLYRLKNILKMSDNAVFRIQKKIKSQKPWDPVIISDNLTWAEFSRINLFLHELQGVEPIISVARVYREQSSSHVIGYVSKISKRDLQQKNYLVNMKAAGMRVGKTGLEHKLDSEIIGDVGHKRYEVNAFGKRIKEVSIDQGKNGKNFKTTLDLKLQNLSTNLLKDKAGAICVMDIYRGDIITMVSSPTFDPNKFVHGINTKDWKELINHRDKPLVNKAISGLYPPGSTIKGLVAISALENDVVNTKMVQQCSGSIELYGEKFHCWKKKGHGFVDMRKAIKESCDIYFYEVARRLGIDRLSETARSFGLGDTMVKGFHEEKIGVVPNTKWKKQRIGKSWYLGETLHSGIGQGYWQTTPMQLCLMTARIANGGYDVEPRIVLGEKNKFSIFTEKKKNPKSLEDFFNSDVSNEFDDTTINLGYKPLFKNQENINFVKDAFFGATNEPGGTSYGSRLSKKEFMFAGKTGTSQVRRITEKQRELEIKNEDLPYEQRDHALFVAFAPYNKPQYSISVVIEHGGSGSKSAAPIAKKVIKKLMERHPIRKQIHDNYKGEDV